ncbi:hypothetical protein [Chryseobacterium sp. 2987]|uniref:hypothetical protein n=1 Tax=Chryseobacterium sp. 2987 TaxID=2817767 RepID=UPI00285F2100|nr:hypothetical protein [Chryseobacterium sp. 2987]MDR6922767.1 hypothetical protein [Chryseobacterium sp. 2987]
MKAKNLLILLFTSVLILSCNKKLSDSGENASQLNETLSITKDTVKNNSFDSISIAKRDSVFQDIKPSEHEEIKGKYNKIFDGTDLEAKVFEINGSSFNALLKKYKSSKKYLDIYFILDGSGQRNLILKFTSEPIGENFTLKNGDHQYIINNKNLQLADSESLLDLSKKFIVRYENEIKRLPNKRHTILTRDELAKIKDVYGILKLYPCIDNTDKASLTSEYKDASGNTMYGNRGSLYP